MAKVGFASGSWGDCQYEVIHLHSGIVIDAIAKVDRRVGCLVEHTVRTATLWNPVDVVLSITVSVCQS